MAVQNHFEEHMVYFVYLLRQQGLRVGTAEAMEALEAISVAGVEDRQAFKAALQATLVKKAADFDVFERTFENYFVPAEVKEEKIVQGREQAEKYEENLQKVEEELTFKGEQLNLEETEKVVYASLPEKEQERIKQFVSETEHGKNVESSFKPVLESIVKGSLRYWRSRQDERMHKPPSVTGDPGWDWMLADDGGGSGGGAGDGAGGESGLARSLKEMDMSQISEKDVPEAAELIRKMTRRLSNSLSRRYRASRKKRELDLRRTIRDNISYGGSIYHLRYRDRRKQKLRLLLLCDTSGSMIRYTSFILPFIYGLNMVVSDIESFVFSEGLEKITDYMEKRDSFEEARRELMKKSNQWGGGTRLAVAVERLMKEHEEVLTPKTIVIIVSDTRTTLLHESRKRIENLQDRVKDVIWLNTLPHHEWDQLRSVQMFREVSRMYPCNRLADLEQVFAGKII